MKKKFRPSIAFGVPALILAGATVFLDCTLKENIPITEKKREQIVDSDPRTQEPTEESREPHKYSFMDVYDSPIDESLDYFRAIHGRAPQRNLIKAMIDVESCGSPKHLDTAFVYDPMQIANNGDHALEVLANGKECSYLIGNFSSLKGIKHTHWRHGQWDYSECDIDADHSIFGGIGWVFHKAVKRDKRITEQGPVKTYQIEKGDTYSEIASKLGTTTLILKKYNPNVGPRELQIGQVVKFRTAEEEVFLSGWRSWNEAVKRYNGGGNPNYLSHVLSVKRQLDEMDKEK